jgi:hypothetical protein
MLEFNQLKELMSSVVNAERSAAVAYSFNAESFSCDQLQDTLRAELNELAGSYALYRENKNTIFALMEQVLNDYLPKKVLEEYGRFAEVKTFAQGTKPVFKHRTGKMRAKQFITKVGLAGIYEVFKLGSESFEVTTSAIGGAAQIGLEEFLDGRVDFAELTQIVMDGMNELVYREIAKALTTSIEQLPDANRVAAANFDEAEFDRLLASARAYGMPTIYCTHEFAVKMLPDANWVSDAMKDEKWANGYFTRYKGYPVIILPQSFEDESNAVKVIDPGYCWIIPTGGDDKPVKVAFEGDTIVDEATNADRSREIQVYKKVGVVVMMTNNIFSYVDTALRGQLENKVIKG